VRTPAERSIADRLFGGLRLYANLAGPTYQEGYERDFTRAQIRDREHPDALDRAWALTKALVLKFDQEVRRDGARLAVAIVPEKRSFPEWRFRHLTPAERVARRESVWPIEDLMEDFLAENDIPHVNLMRYLKSDNIEDIQCLFFVEDNHFNVSGHRRIARIVHDWTVEHYTDLDLPAVDLPKPKLTNRRRVSGS
jgi:hypothetical protein